MEFRIADTFQAALGKLTRDEQKAVKTSVFDLQTNPEHPGLQWHRIGDTKDANFWSCRAGRDIRIIVHKTAQSFLLAYVGHHDDAYKWAERRRIEAHPRTGAIQVVEVRERVEEVAPPRPVQQQLDLGDGIDMLPLGAPRRGEPALCFGALDAGKLMSIGVPADWINDILAATEDNFLDIATHLPAEAGEALLEFISTGVLNVPAPVTVADPFQHPDALRRFRVVENVAELEQALSFPWEKWIVFLHPSQRDLVEREFDGPVRVTGSAGTGKTVVALHRAARLADKSPDARVLLTTFSDPLAVALERRLKVLVGESAAVVPRIRVASFLGIARELYELIHARQPAIAGSDLVKSLLTKAAATAGGEPPIAERFLHSEWTNAVDAWQVSSADAYAAVPRLGRKRRMGKKQRDRLWPIFETVQRQIAQRGLLTEAGVFRAVAEHYRERSAKPFDNIVVDEAQDLGVLELRFLGTIAPAAPDALFFTGDLGLRIFQQPFSWKALGVDVAGRSVTLSVNYRTSHQIREAADRLMPGPISDADGEKDDRSGAISVFNGPEPIVVLADDADDDVYATERHLFYVACTRARDRLLVSGLRPGSEFLGDLRAQ